MLSDCVQLFAEKSLRIDVAEPMRKDGGGRGGGRGGSSRGGMGGPPRGQYRGNYF